MALNNSAWLYYRAGRDPEVALTRIERAVGLEAANPRFQHTYGCVLLWMDRAEEALSRLRSARELSSDSADARDAFGCPPAGAPASRGLTPAGASTGSARSVATFRSIEKSFARSVMTTGGW